jgi:hypothetical protein
MTYGVDMDARERPMSLMHAIMRYRYCTGSVNSHVIKTLQAFYYSEYVTIDSGRGNASGPIGAQS